MQQGQRAAIPTYNARSVNGLSATADNYRSVSIMLEFNREHPNNQADATEKQWYERIQCDGQNDRYSDQKDRKTPANPVKKFPRNFPNLTNIGSSLLAEGTHPTILLGPCPGLLRDCSAYDQEFLILPKALIRST